MTNGEISDRLKNIDVYKTRRMVFLKNHHADVYVAIFENTRFLDDTNGEKREISFAERLYCVENDITERVRCPICGKNLRFNTDVSSYRKSCSTSCSRKNAETMLKFRATLKTKKDPTNAEKSRETRFAKNGGKWHAPDFAEKTRATLLRKHGDPHWNNAEKFRRTSLERYGTDHPMKNPDVKMRQTERVRELYGVNSAFRLDCVRLAAKTGIRKRAWRQMSDSADVRPLTSEEDFLKIRDINEDDCVKFECKRCGQEFTSYWDNGHARPCPNCNPVSHGTSEQEIQLVEFIKSVVPRGFSVLNKTCTNRRIIPPKEIDIVVKNENDDLVLAVEYDGLFWHRDDGARTRGAHLEKTEYCEKAGVRLVHVFENEWLTKRDIVESRIKNMLGVHGTTLYARNCEIREINSADARKFQDETHLQGSVNGKVNVGLTHGGKLVGLMVFGKCRFDKRHDWELLRFSTKLGYSIPGGAGKMLAYFERKYRPKSLVSYADRRWSRGRLYAALGFRLDHVSPPNYWYFRNGDTRYLHSRVTFQKHKLKGKLKSFDESKSETENMKANGYSRIFDCGNLVFEKTY